ncbi:unnamed protein product [Microthlaspi erraticum]|uniref:Uncharacterized protein n=1 Tax=Microthlaspi erraticum TaxID=1685480 RepID=A0A6D2IIH3_9BRAS|nr:unnamed protein product [Microthlaspi erraticum]
MRQAAATNRSRRNDAMMGIRKKWRVCPTCWAKQNTRTPYGQLLRQLNATTMSLICFPRHMDGSRSFPTMHNQRLRFDFLRCNHLFSLIECTYLLHKNAIYYLSPNS